MKQLLEKCAQIEHMVSEIYFEFSINTDSDEILKNIWENMSRDEEDHCQQLRLAARLPGEESFEGIKDNCPDPQDLYEIAGTLLEDVKSRPFTVLEMLKTAVILEKEFRKLHAPYSLIFKDNSLRKTFGLLARADQEHLKELDTYLKAYKAKNIVS